MPRGLRQKSTRLSWLLRHGAIASGLRMDAAGFAPVEDVLRLARMSRNELDEVVAKNDKGRYELTPDGACVRACQGHSTAGTPVTQAGLEATWSEVLADDPLFHGTDVVAARSILVEGIRAVDRTHVHLAASPDAKVGKRAHVDVLLTVAPPLLRALGFALFRAPNGVLLARAVPREAIGAIVAVSRRGERALAELGDLARSAGRSTPAASPDASG